MSRHNGMTAFDWIALAVGLTWIGFVIAGLVTVAHFVVKFW